MELNGTVLIADDEELARTAIRTMLSRVFPRLEIVADVGSGREAVEKYRELNPDIVFLDIQMPGINGTEAASQILKGDPSALIIMLTAYDSFGYVHRSINTGAKAYLLKPINSDALCDAVIRVTEQKSTSTQNSFTPELKAYIERELVHALTAQRADWGKIHNLSELAKVDLTGGFCILVSGNFPVSEMLEILDEEFRRISFLAALVYGFIAVFFLTDRDGIRSGTEFKIADRLNTACRRRLPESGRMIVSSQCSSDEMLRDGYEQCLKYLIEDSQPGVFFTSENEKVDDPDTDSLTQFNSLYESMMESLETGRISQCRNILRDYTLHLRNIPADLGALLEQINTLLVLARLQGLKRGLVTSVWESKPILQNLSQISDQRHLASFLDSTVSEYLGHFEPTGNRETRSLVAALSFLEDNIFDEQLSLEQIADQSGLSPQYLSRKIKEKLGSNFVEYITAKRLEYAQYLLLTSNLSIKDIAVRSGYPDANYFSRIFKKNLNQTPLQFRRNATEK